MKPETKDNPRKAVHHLRCVVCGRTFASEFDEELRAYKVFHTKPGRENEASCEDRFYMELMRVYSYLHQMQNSVTISEMVRNFEWLGFVMMKKEMLRWCMERGYLGVDNLYRIETPPQIVDEFSELFESVHLLDEEKFEMAAELLKESLKVMIEHGELHSVPGDEIPIKEIDLDRGPSLLFEKLDTSGVVLKREKKEGMITVRRTGARDIEKRMSAASNTMERRRLDRMD